MPLPSPPPAAWSTISCCWPGKRAGAGWSWPHSSPSRSWEDIVSSNLNVHSSTAPPLQWLHWLVQLDLREFWELRKLAELSAAARNCSPTTNIATTSADLSLVNGFSLTHPCVTPSVQCFNGFVTTLMKVAMGTIFRESNKQYWDLTNYWIWK